MNPGELSRLKQLFAEALARYGDAVLTYLEQRPSEVGDALRLAEPELQVLANDPDVIQTLTEQYRQGGGTAEGTLGVVWGGRNDAAMQYAQDRAAELVGMRRLLDGRLVLNPNPKWSIQEASRTQVHKMVTDVIDAGADYRQLAEAIRQHPAFQGTFGEYRAEMIARTELSTAMNQGVLDGYEKFGVEAVFVLDNPDCKICGPVADTVQTLEWAMEHPLGHPHCIRAFNTATIERSANGGFPRGVERTDIRKEGITAGLGLTGYNLEGQHQEEDCDGDDCTREHKHRERVGR